MRRLAVPVLLAAALALSGCGLTSSSSADESLVIYSGRQQVLVEPLFATFTQETGIRVEVRYGDTGELAAQLLEEGDKTPADVFFAQDAGALGAVAAAGRFSPLPAAVSQRVPATYRSADNTWTGVTARARVIAYDSVEVAKDEVPTSVFELTDPKWKGKLGIAPTNASFQSFVTAMRVSEGDEVARAWLEGIVANDPQVYEKNGLILDAVDSGQISLGLINHYYWYEKAAEVGEASMRAQISFAKPQDPGALVNVSGVGILQPSDNATRFVEWLLSDQAQRYFSDEVAEYPVVESVAAREGLPPLSSLRGPDIQLAELADLPGTLVMLEEVGLL